MNKWHYVTVKMNIDELTDVDWLNGYGEQGLELVCIERLDGKPLQ
jgi:hypothetical protein